MEINPRLSKKQGILYEKFLDGDITEILYGGGGRCGKTRGVSEIVNITCIQYPGIARLIGRDKLKKLKETTFNTFIKVLKHHGLKKDVHYTINMSDMVLQYRNGSKIYFTDLGWMPSDPFYDRLGGYDLTFSRVDEAQEVRRIAIDTLAGRYSEKLLDYGLTGKGILTCNPKKGHLYTDFVKPSGSIKDHRVFIPASYLDNPHIDQDKYKKSIIDTGNKVFIERLLKGNREYDDNPFKLYEYDAILDIYTNRQVGDKSYLIFDPARMGEDRAVASRREGLRLVEWYVWEKCTLEKLQADLKKICDQHGIPMSRVLGDMDGLGAGVVDGLRCKGFNNNGSPIQTKYQKNEGIKENYEHIKAQCGFHLSKIIEDFSISDENYRDMVIEELDVIEEIDVDGPKRKLIKKKDIKEKIGRSPNFFDNIMMRMRFELQPEVTVYIPTTTFL